MNIKTAGVLALGFVLVVSGLSLWVLGDATNSVVTLPLALTGVTWSPLIWLLGIIIILSAGLANTVPFKNYVEWLAVLVVGYLAVFAILVSFTSMILPH